MFDLNEFTVPKGFRGRSAFFVQLWWLVDAIAFRTSPQFMYGWRVFLLRLFGAKIGDCCVIRPTVKITYPWKVSLGNNVWLGDDAVLYSLGEITIGSNSVISQKCYLCTGSHDYKVSSFDIFSMPIRIGDGTWIATDVFVGPGVSIGDSIVVGARSSVFSDLGGSAIYIGSPAKKIRDLTS